MKAKRSRPSGRTLLRRFLAGVSMLALARRYKVPRAWVEERIRRVGVLR